MTATLTVGEVFAGLVRAGVPRDVAERRARDAVPYLAGAPDPALAIAVERDRGMNKTEARRAEHLEQLRIAGVIRRWDYQPEKLRLADNTFLTIDFRVVLLDGTIEMEDVKGRAKNGSYWCEEDAKIKLKVAAELHPYRFTIVWPLADGGWGREEI